MNPEDAGTDQQPWPRISRLRKFRSHSVNPGGTMKTAKKNGPGGKYMAMERGLFARSGGWPFQRELRQLAALLQPRGRVRRLAPLTPSMQLKPCPSP